MSESMLNVKLRNEGRKEFRREWPNNRYTDDAFGRAIEDINFLLQALEEARAAVLSEAIEKVKAKEGDWDAKAMSTGDDATANRYFDYKHAAGVVVAELKAMITTQGEVGDGTTKCG